MDLQDTGSWLMDITPMFGSIRIRTSLMILFVNINTYGINNYVKQSSRYTYRVSYSGATLGFQATKRRESRG